MSPLRMLGPLMLMVLLSDAETSCPDDSNLLTLDPPKLIAEYNEEVSLNCSTTEIVDNLNWKIGDTATLEMVEDGYVIWSTSLSDWNVKAECIIRLNDTFECSRNLEITMYQTPDKVLVTPLSSDPMVAGKPYKLKCEIDNVAPVQNLKVRWYKDRLMFYTETINQTSVLPVNVSAVVEIPPGQLHDRADFRCQVELDFGPEGPNVPPVTSPPYTADVHYKPLIEGCVGLHHLVETVGTLDTVPCNVSGNPPPTVQWYYSGKEINASEPLDRTHSGEYTVEASNSIGRSNLSVSISIEYAPEFENITYKIFVDKGTNVTLTCEADGNPLPEFSWTVDGRNISENGEELNIPQVMTSANYTCTATNSLGNMTKQIYVHVTNTEKLADPVAMNSPEDSTIKGCPLTLTPAEVVVRFGDPVSINCSTSATDAVGMGWEASFGGTDFKKNTRTVIWKVDKLEEWAIEPECYVTQINSKQCIVKPAVTVYKTPEMSLSTYDLMVEGRTYQLGCKINNVAPVQNLTVKWYRNKDMLHVEKFDQTSVIPVSVFSNLNVTAERNHNGAVFRCEAELHLGPKGPELIPTVTSPSFTAVVHYEPQIQNCSGDHSLVENKDNLALLPCQFDGNPAPSVQWYYQGEEMNATEPLNRAHSGKYTVVASNSVGSSNISVDITVEYGPSLACKGQYKVHKGANVQTTCEAEGLPPPVIQWLKGGANEFTSESWTKDDSGMYLLTATNTHGKAYDLVTIDVLYEPQIQNCSGDHSLVENEGNLALLPCQFDGNPAPSVQWYYQGEEMNATEPLNRAHSGKYTVVASNSVGSSNISVDITVGYGPSFACKNQYKVHEGANVQTTCEAEGLPPPVIQWLKDGENEFTPESWTKDDSGNYSLTATNTHGRANHTLSIDVLYEPQIQKCSGDHSLVENEGNLALLPCQFDGNPAPSVQWYYQGKEMNATEPLNRAHSGKYTVVASNSVGSSSISVDITVEYGPSFACKRHYKVHKGANVQTTCKVEGSPLPDIQWLKDGENELTSESWTKDDSGNYSLTATNTHGRANHTLSIDVLYAPMFSEGNYTKEVATGENVTLSCGAEGNPSPEIQWKPQKDVNSSMNVMETTRERQRNINITRATSTNAGVYNCVATNEVGTVTKSVTLIIKDKTSGIPSYVLWLLLIILIVVIGILIIIYRNHRRKQGQYHFVPDKAKDGADIPMTAKSNGV